MTPFYCLGFVFILRFFFGRHSRTRSFFTWLLCSVGFWSGFTIIIRIWCEKAAAAAFSHFLSHLFRICRCVVTFSCYCYRLLCSMWSMLLILMCFATVLRFCSSLFLGGFCHKTFETFNGISLCLFVYLHFICKYHLQ